MAHSSKELNLKSNFAKLPIHGQKIEGAQYAMIFFISTFLRF
jgi:hypothetical protein